MNRLAMIAFALAIAGSSLVSGALVHRYDTAQYLAAVEKMRADAATTLADQTAIVLGLLQDQIDRNTQLEEDYARADQLTQRLRADGNRLSHDLDHAIERVRQLTRAGGGGGDGAAGQADAGNDRCASVRAALAGALGAVELLKSAGDEIAADGQHAVDVATVAAAAARQREAGGD